MQTSREIDDVVARFLREKLDLIKETYAPLQMIIFGSRATGDAGPDSDIDLIIVSERFREISIPDRMGDFLNTLRPDVAVDAICYTPEEFDTLTEKQWPFVRNAVEHGIRID